MGMKQTYELWIGGVYEYVTHDDEAAPDWVDLSQGVQNRIVRAASDAMPSGHGRATVQMNALAAEVVEAIRLDVETNGTG